MDPSVLRGSGTSSDGPYVNFLDRDDQERVRMAYSEETYRRLAMIKGVYDPDNVFRLNHNINPTLAEPSPLGT